jgi:hypothetical protein
MASAKRENLFSARQKPTRFSPLPQKDQKNLELNTFNIRAGTFARSF